MCQERISRSLHKNNKVMYIKLEIFEHFDVFSLECGAGLG